MSRLTRKAHAALSAIDSAPVSERMPHAFGFPLTYAGVPGSSTQMVMWLAGQGFIEWDGTVGAWHVTIEGRDAMCDVKVTR
jgi:hypothetical protein